MLEETRSTHRSRLQTGTRTISLHLADLRHVRGTAPRAYNHKALVESKRDFVMRGAQHCTTPTPLWTSSISFGRQPRPVKALRIGLVAAPDALAFPHVEGREGCFASRGVYHALQR